MIGRGCFRQQTIDPDFAQYTGPRNVLALRQPLYGVVKELPLGFQDALQCLLIDQVQQRSCTLFVKARVKAERPRYFWDKVRRLFLTFPVADWETLYQAIAFGYRGEMVLYDTS